jgi:hypothetical protein
MLRARLPLLDNTFGGNMARSGGMWLFYDSSKDGRRLVHLPLRTSLGNGNPSLLQDFMRGWLDGLPSMIKYVCLLFNRHFLTLLNYWQSIDVIDSPELRELLPRGVWEKSGRHDLGGEGPAIPLTKFLFISYKGRDAPQDS